MKLSFSVKAAYVSFKIGLLVLACWWIGISPFKDSNPNWIEMNPLTAMLFVLTSIALWLNQAKPKTPAWYGSKGASIFTLVVGSVVLLQYVGFTADIDTFLFSASLGTNRMAPNTAFCFVLLTLALLTLNLEVEKRKVRASEIFSIAILTISVTALIGYKYGTMAFYEVGPFIPMAVHSAVAFVAISLGTLFYYPDSGLVSILTRKDMGGHLARRLLPPVILVPLVLGWLRLEGQRQGLYTAEFGTALYVIINIIFLVALTWIYAAVLSRLDNSLREQSQVLKLVLDNMRDAVAVTDNTGQFTLYNAAAKDILGIEMSQSDPEKWSEIYGVYLKDEVTRFPIEDNPLMRALKGESTLDIVQYIKNKERPDGLFISVNGNPMRDQYGRIQGAVAVFRDVTAQIRKEQKLLDANEDLRSDIEERSAQLRQLQKMDAVGTLAGGVAHDFNNILGAINMYCDMIKDYADQPDSVIENVREIKLASNRGSTLTRQLLTFGRKQLVVPRDVDLNSLIQSFNRMLTRLVGEQYQIITHLADSIDLIHADPGQIEQVIMNLVLNARDAMPRGGKITIETANINLDKSFASTHLSVNPGPHVVLSIKDHGCGIDPQHKPRLFEPFFTTKPVGKGVGMGLPIVYGIVEQSKGTIAVQSEVGIGTTFKLYFPTIPSAAKPTVAEPNAYIRSEKLTSANILLVEDEPMMRRLVEKALTKRRFTVTTASNGLEGVKILNDDHSKSFHLLLTDIVMPEMGGMDLAKYAELKNPNIKILFMSGYTSDLDELQEKSHQKKFNFIQKPFDSEQLTAKVLQVLNQDS